MKQFFLSLLSSGPKSVGSKRFIAIGSFIMVIIAAFFDIFWKKSLSEYMYYGLLGLIGACCGFNTILSKKSMEVKSDVASDIITNEPNPSSSEDAKEVLANDKP